MHVYEKGSTYINENGYKQIAVAAKAGIPATTFNAILNGNVPCMLMIYVPYVLP